MSQNEGSVFLDQGVFAAATGAFAAKPHVVVLKDCVRFRYIFGARPQKARAVTQSLACRMLPYRSIDVAELDRVPSNSVLQHPEGLSIRHLASERDLDVPTDVNIRFRSVGPK